MACIHLGSIRTPGRCIAFPICQEEAESCVLAREGQKEDSGSYAVGVAGVERGSGGSTELRSCVIIKVKVTEFETRGIDQVSIGILRGEGGWPS